MKHDAIARLWFRPEIMRRWFPPGRTPVETRLLGQVRFAPDDQHPYGQWTLCAELWTPPDRQGLTLAWVGLLAPEAWTAWSQGNPRGELFQGRTQLAEVEVLWREATAQQIDTDSWADPDRGVRSLGVRSVTPWTIQPRKLRKLRKP